MMLDSVRQTLDRYRENEIMLDALFQWASNPSRMSAGYGLVENYPYIAKNLAARHGIPRQEAEKCVAELRDICSTFDREVSALPIEPRQRTGEIQRTLLDALDEEGPQKVLRAGLVRRLKEVSEETRRALLLLVLLGRVNSNLSPNDLRRPPDRYVDHQSEFQAYYKAVLGDTVPVLRVLEEIVKCGAYNELYWVPSPTAKSSASPTLVQAILPTREEIEAAGTRLPLSPDIPALIESLWQKGSYDLLRFADIVSHSNLGVCEINGALPLNVNIPSFMAVHGQTAALSPLVGSATKQQIEMTKADKTEGARRRVENALVAVAQNLGADAALGVLWSGMGEVLWSLRLTASPPLYVYLCPWLTTFAQSPGISRINLSEKPHILFVIPCQSFPSILNWLEETSGFSLKDRRWEKSLGILSDPQQPQEFRLLVGERHRLLDAMLAELGQAGPPPPSLDVTLMVTPTSVSVGGEVTAEVEVLYGQGNPVEGVEVVVAWGDQTSNSNGLSNADGHYSASHSFGEAGTYVLEATAAKGGLGEAVSRKQLIVTRGEHDSSFVLIGSASVKDTDRGVLGWSGTRRVELDMFVGRKDGEDRAHTITVLGIPKFGKSYTLGVIIEMALAPQPAVRTGANLPVVVFHYDKNVAYKPEFANVLSPAADHLEELNRLGIRPNGVDDVMIFVPPWRLAERVKEFPGANVRPLLFSPDELSQFEWRLLLGVPGSEALYVEQVKQVLLKLSIKQKLGLDSIRIAVEESAMSSQSKKLAQQRLELATQWIADGASLRGSLKPGRLVILDIRDAMIDPSDAMRLCLISLGLFQQVQTDKGLPMPKLIVLDEAHKYVQQQFADEIVTVVNQMRHTATTVIVASQNADSIPLDVLEKSSVVILHRLTSPKQIGYLKRAVQGLSTVSERVVAQLDKGQAIVWATESTDSEASQSGIKVVVRPRFTLHVHPEVDSEH